jgi:signal transduction histidine kinase
MKIYHSLSRFIPTRNKYALKFFVVALPMIVIALAELIVFVMISKGKIRISFDSTVIFFLLLINISAVSIIILFDKLVTPLRVAKEALDNYIASREIPELPVVYTDEAGLLLGNIQATLTQMDGLLSEKSDMIDLLSHDLRSPVGRISSIASLIKSDPESKDLYSDYITNECKGLIRMLENILLMLKEESNTLNVTNVNLKQLIQETVSFFDFAAAEKSLQMKLAIDETIYINVQPELFTQAVRNIIGNAIKFSPDGKSICISGKQDMEKISLSIQDEGLGFKPRDIQKLFDRFTSAGKKGTHGETSTGLGLYLSKKIVEKHGGKLLAESEGINHGASFTIVLYRLVTKKAKSKTGAREKPATQKLRAVKQLR